MSSIQVYILSIIISSFVFDKKLFVKNIGHKTLTKYYLNNTLYNIGLIIFNTRKFVVCLTNRDITFN